jgi:hypothetical protein
MDPALVRFRQAAARENHDREGVRRRYSARLQRQAVAYWRGRQQDGADVRQVAAALGVSAWSLHRWTRAHPARERFQAVEVVPAAATPTAVNNGVTVIIVTTDSVRVEGLDVPGTAQLLRLLR